MLLLLAGVILAALPSNKTEHLIAKCSAAGAGVAAPMEEGRGWMLKQVSL